MKSILRLIGIFIIFLISTSVFAESRREEVMLKLPDDFMQTVCPTPVWRGQSVLWKGVSDGRPESEVGRQVSKKGKEIIDVEAQPSIDRVVEESLKVIFQACGLKLVSTDPADVTMSVRIEEFFVGAEKKFVTGKATGKSRLRFLLKNRYGTAEKWVDIGYEIEAKKIRQSNIKQLESNLNELLASTLSEVPKNDYLKSLMF